MLDRVPFPAEGRIRAETTNTFGSTRGRGLRWQLQATQGEVTWSASRLPTQSKIYIRKQLKYKLQ